MRNFIIYLFPMLFDIVIALTMFVGRHSYAERNAGVMEIGAFAAVYGLVFIPSSYLIGKIISPEKAKIFLLASIALIITLLCLLANTDSYPVFLAIFAGVPFGASLFFNSFQSYMLKEDNNIGKKLSRSVGHYTFSWSLGLALGPVVSYFGCKYFDWSASFYLAAVILTIVGLFALFIKPAKGSTIAVSPEEAPAPDSNEKALPLSGWIGILIATSSFQLILIYWPLLAVQLNYPTIIKSGLEFSASFVQALAALVLCLFVSWYHKPWTLLCFGFVGFLGLLFLALAEDLPLFFIGASLFGIYTSSSFLFMVYHAMLDRKKAVKRIAINEIMVGTGIIIGPIIATGCLKLANNDFHTAFKTVLIIFSAALLIQTGIALREKSLTK